MPLTNARYLQTFDPVPGHATRFSTLLRSLDEDELAMSVPGMGWTAGEVGVHVLNVLLRYGVNARRSPTRHDLAAQNEEEVRATGLSREEVADGIDAAVVALAEVAPHIPLDQRFAFHLGLEVDAAAGWANLCSEFLVHGADIARATGRSWTFPDEDVEGMWRNLMPAIGGWLRPEAQAIDEVYEFRFSFGAVTIWLTNGRILVDDVAAPVSDHVILIDEAAAFTLAVPWRRALVEDAGAALFLSRLYDI